MGDRGRSRSRGRGGVAEAARGGSSEHEIVSVAIRQLPGDIRGRLQKLFDEGLLKEGDLDLRSITVFASLNEGLQSRVMNHMEGERIYVANARSKSGFLIATCDKAKTGCLDARGLGAIDPWRTALVAMATPKMKQADLRSETSWLEEMGQDAVIKIEVELGTTVEGELGVPSVTVELPLTETCAAIKAKLVAMGVKAVASNKMMLNEERVGFLKERYSFAYYNLKDGTKCSLSERKRGGAKFRPDHTVMPKRPKAQTNPAPAPSPVDALKAATGGASMPKFPGMPSLPGLQGLAAGLPTPGKAGLPGLPGGLQLPGLGGGGMPPGMAELLAKAKGGLPGLPGGLDLSKLPGMPSMPGGLPPPGGLPGGLGGSLPKLGGLPGLPGMTMPTGGLPGMGGCAPKAGPM